MELDVADFKVKVYLVREDVFKVLGTTAIVGPTFQEHWETLWAVAAAEACIYLKAPIRAWFDQAKRRMIIKSVANEAIENGGWLEQGWSTICEVV